MFDVDLVVACTNRKGADVPTDLKFHSLPNAQVPEVAAEWSGRAGRAHSLHPAERLYQGPGWASVLRAKAFTQNSRLHVLSAGFGLLQADSLIPAYSATFAEHADQVALKVKGAATPAEAHRRWWSAINLLRVGTPTPLTERLERADRVVLACGVEYLEATLDDLEQLAGRLGQERLVIVSAGARSRRLPAAIARCVLPGGVELQLLERVPRSRLNYFGAEWVLRTAAELGWDPNAIARRLEEEIAGRKEAGGTLPKSGLRQTDDNVKMWIRKTLSETPAATGLHRRFRSEGLACEEKRFRLLAAQVRAEQAGVG